MNKVNIRKKLASLTEHWSQETIGEVNGQLFKVAKGIGSTNWHKHDDEDELFILYKGHLTIMSWAQQLKPVFESEVEKCEK